jgi:ubiquinone biosynthesis protein
MWAVAEPVVRQWIERNLGTAGRLEDATEGTLELGKFLGGLPAMLTRAGQLADQLDAITRNGLVLAPETVAAIGAAEARKSRWMTAALWVIAVGVAWFVWLVWRAM